MYQTLVNFFAAFLPALLATGVFGYLIQNQRAARATQLEDKQKHYVAILSNVFKLLYVQPGVQCAEVVNHIEKSWFYASDDVLAKVYEVMDVHRKLGRDPILMLNNDRQLRKEFDDALRVLFVAMRKDLTGSRWWRPFRPRWPADKVGLYHRGVLAEPIERPE